MSLKVLHVASFTGNIGDNANHVGFRTALENALDLDISYTEFEIREVYWKRRAFDRNFVELANDHDLVVVGGGNYFELWVDDSATGCSFDIEIELLKSIEKPLIFNALGVDPAQGASDEALARFREFLDVVDSMPNTLLSCRNDGSLKALEEVVGPEFAERFLHVPDAGLFTVPVDSYHPELNPNKKNVIIQLAGDMLDTRFQGGTAKQVSYEEFVEGMTSVVTQLFKLNCNTIFVPHIFRDISVFTDIFDCLPDDIRRGGVVLAPYLNGQRGQDYIFDLYAKADLVLAMRFHANLCSLGLETPCIGLVNYRQIKELYEEMELNDYAVVVNKPGFDSALIELCKSMLMTSGSGQSVDLSVWRAKYDRYIAKFAELIA